MLPQWSNGTAFLFPTGTDAAGAKELWSQISGSPRMALGYDSRDSLEQAIAERIALNARDAGISISSEAVPAAGSTAGNYDVRLMRLRMKSARPREALSGFVAALAPPAGLDATPVPAAASADQVYGREREVVSSYRVVPVVWLPRVYGLGSRVMDWKAPAAGEGWPLADVWLEQESQ